MLGALTWLALIKSKTKQTGGYGGGYGGGRGGGGYSSSYDRGYGGGASYQGGAYCIC